MDYIMRPARIRDLLWIVLYSLLARWYWYLAWCTCLDSRKHREKSTHMWCEGYARLTDWCAAYVYHGSEWHGLNCKVDERPGVVRVKLDDETKTP